MTGNRRALSSLIAFHLFAVLLASLPDPGELRVVQPHRSGGSGGVHATVTATLDLTASWLHDFEARLFTATKLLRAVTEPYIRIGLRQTWNMFSNPMTVDQYVRVDQYVDSAGQPTRIFGELALPAQREDRVRLVHKFRDKAVLNALEAFSATRNRRQIPEGIPNDLVPVARYFRNRFQRDYLNGSGHVVRTDVWFGEAAIPPLGQRLNTAQLQARAATLASYWGGPAGMPRGVLLPRPGAVQREDAILWRLEYVDEP